MKKLIFLLLLAASALAAMSQGYPSEWGRYTGDAYYHDIESDASKQAALDRARVNLARQVQVRVSEVSQMQKQAVNGRSSILYHSQQDFATDVDMDLVESRTHYNPADGRHYALVFIDKAAACTYYDNQMQMTIRNLDNAIAIASDYVSKGFKQRAKAELQKALPLLDDVAKPLFWLNVFGLDEARLIGYHEIVLDREQELKRSLADLEYGTTYCVSCRADLFGKPYNKLAGDVKGALSAQGCNFVDNPSQADYIIVITASARKYNTFQGAYFTYIDATVSISKSATDQQIFADEASVKGSHTISYDEAARDGYKKITKEITKLIKDNIKL